MKENFDYLNLQDLIMPIDDAEKMINGTAKGDLDVTEITLILQSAILKRELKPD